MTIIAVNQRVDAFTEQVRLCTDTTLYVYTTMVTHSYVNTV